MPEEILYTVVTYRGEPVILVTHQSRTERDAYQRAVYDVGGITSIDNDLACFDLPLDAHQMKYYSPDFVDALEKFVARTCGAESD